MLNKGSGLKKGTKSRKIIEIPDVHPKFQHVAGICLFTKSISVSQNAKQKKFFFGKGANQTTETTC